MPQPLEAFECGTATHRPPHRSHPCGNESGLPRTRGTVAASGKHSPQFARTDLHHLAKLLLGEKTYQQVADELGISPDTVKKHISKALRTLREAILKRRINNEKEFSTNDHIHPDNGKNPHNQDSPQNGTWNDHQLEQLFGEALGDIPTADETRKAWQTFIRRHRIRHQSIRRITIPGIAAAVIALVLVFQPLLQPEPQEVEVFTSLEVPEEITFREEGKRIIVSTPPATITSVQLSDGSKVLLSANSRLEYLKEFTDTIRSVKLSGEARLK